MMRTMAERLAIPASVGGAQSIPKTLVSDHAMQVPNNPFRLLGDQSVCVQLTSEPVSKMPAANTPSTPATLDAVAPYQRP